MQKLTVDKEFKTLIPPLSKEERNALEQSILSEGCRDPIVTWQGTVIDGHNRYEICNKHNIPFAAKGMDFNSREDAMLWMVDNQFGRRNLNDYQKIELARVKASIFEERAKENKKEGNSRGGRGKETDEKEVTVKNDRDLNPTTNDLENSPIRVRDKVADFANVSSTKVAQLDVVKKYEAENNTSEFTDKLKADEISIGKAYSEVRLKKKKAEVKEAEQKIAREADAEFKPILYIGDGRTHEGKYDLLLTDPPYSTDVDDINLFVESWLYKALDGIKPTGFGYVFIGAYPNELRAYLNAKIPSHIELCQILVWTYKNTLGNNPKDRYKLNYQACLFYRGLDAPSLDCPLTNEQWAVQEVNAPDGRLGDRCHAWQKPIELAERFIRHSTKEGMTVFDGFACTGTFLLAASKLGRKSIGFEIDENNAKIAFDRGCVNGDSLSVDE